MHMEDNGSGHLHYRCRHRGEGCALPRSTRALAEIDLAAISDAATDDERRVLVDELLDRIEVHGDHLEAVVRGAPSLNVTLDEVGLESEGENQTCRRAEDADCHWRLIAWSVAA